MCLGCLMRSQYSYAMPVSLSMMDEAMAVSGNRGGVVPRQSVVADCTMVVGGIGLNLYLRQWCLWTGHLLL